MDGRSGGTGIAGTGEARERVEDLGAVGGEEREKTQGALLKGAVGGERIENQALVRVHDARAEGFGAGGARFEFQKLVERVGLARSPAR